jgi:hypothetical protein
MKNMSSSTAVTRTENKTENYFVIHRIFLLGIETCIKIVMSYCTWGICVSENLIKGQYQQPPFC